jgi:hypothetical protein
MKRYLVAAIILLFAFGVMNVLAQRQTQWEDRLTIGAASGIVAGFASLCLAKARRQVARRARLPDDDPKLRWWFYAGGMVLAGYFGALMALQAALPSSARWVVATAAGILEAFAFMSLDKAVRAGARRSREATESSVRSYLPR